MNDTNRLMEMGHTLLIIAFDEKLTLTRAEIYPRNGNLVATLLYVLNLNCGKQKIYLAMRLSNVVPLETRFGAIS